MMSSELQQLVNQQEIFKWLISPLTPDIWWLQVLNICSRICLCQTQTTQTWLRMRSGSSPCISWQTWSGSRLKSSEAASCHNQTLIYVSWTLCLRRQAQGLRFTNIPRVTVFSFIYCTIINYQLVLPIKMGKTGLNNLQNVPLKCESVFHQSFN